MPATYKEEDVQEAMEIGAAGGQVAIAEYILKAYSSQMGHRLREFLNVVAEQQYVKLGDKLDSPSEDIALKVNEVIDSRIKS